MLEYADIRYVYVKGTARDVYYFFAKEKFPLYPNTRASKFPSQGSRRAYFGVTFSQTQSAESRRQKGTDTMLSSYLSTSHLLSFPHRPQIALHRSLKTVDRCVAA